MPVFPKICKLLINNSMRFVKNEFLTPQLIGLAELVGFRLSTKNLHISSGFFISFGINPIKFRMPTFVH